MADREDREIGEQIRRLRLLRGWTQADLAEKAGLTVEGVSRIERGARAARVSTLRLIASAMETSVATLLDEGPAGRDRAGVEIAADLLTVIEPLLDQPPTVREAAARVVKALVG